jgi:hypothetical protein
MTSNNAIQQRQQNSQEAQQRRLATSSRLDMFMPILRDSCPVCFACRGQVVKHTAFRECPPEISVPANEWMSFKRLFKFDKYTYCYNCGLPQDRGPVKESPQCHRGLRWGKGVFCPWADYVFIVLWCIWNTPSLLSPMLAAFRLPTNITYDDFVGWVTEENSVAGEYYHGLEAFVWFCERWTSSGRAAT